MKFFKNKKGFTLVELVVVIAILGILAGIAIPRFMDATASARGSKIVADLRSIDSAVTMYYAKTSSWPTTAAQLTTAATADAPNQFQLLASWPTCGYTGNADIIFPATPATTNTSIAAAAYVLTGTTNTRGTFHGNNADALSSGGAGYTAN